MEGGPGTSDPGRIDYREMTSRRLIMAAYCVGDYQILAPASADAKALDAGMFEIVAKLPPDATRAQFRLMLQNLLAERFHLVCHREQKIMPVYSLVVGKNGPKLKDSTEAARAGAEDEFDTLPPRPPNELETDYDGYPVVPPSKGSWLAVLRSGPARTHQLSASMRDLAALLSVQLGKPMTDGTGLSGRYEFTLTWMAGVTAAGDAGPDLLAAVQQQLGLKLEASKGPVEMLVIDRLEKDAVEN
jgi:uncharacterized protein (TIGR03435 family)